MPDSQIPAQQSQAQAADVSGIRIVSDGTREGTSVLVDGVELRGVTEVEWKINTATRHAVVVLHMRDVLMDATTSVPADVAEALAKVQAWSQSQRTTRQAVAGSDAQPNI